jgi:dihydroorotate dehydrogenase (fumarate)
MLRTTVGGLELPCAIYNASGPRTGSHEALSKIAASASGAVVSKSATLKEQSGNPLPRFINEIDLGPGMCNGSVNSEGLPNFGIDYYLASEASEAAEAAGKPYILSLSGLSLADNLLMLDKALRARNVSAIELNLACPNIPGKPTIAYDFEQMAEVLEAVCAHKLISKKPLGVKLAPYLDLPLIDKAAAIICAHKAVRYVVAINTLGNALFVDADAECASFAAKDGFGGLGGGFVKQTALANVRLLCRALAARGRADVDVVGVGGVASGRDAFEMILCGAKAVQIGTAHWTEGAAVFARVARELEALMRAKGYASIEAFRGRLKPFEAHKSRIARARRSAGGAAVAGAGAAAAVAAALALAGPAAAFLGAARAAHAPYHAAAAASAWALLGALLIWAAAWAAGVKVVGLKLRDES